VSRLTVYGSRLTLRLTPPVPRIVTHVLRLSACVLLLGACAFPGSVKTTVKIGLSAPFEGLYRNLGYELLYAVRLAMRQRNEAGGLAGRSLVELVALNDFNEPAEAVQQAGEMAVDPGVLGVLGGWSPQTAAAAALEYGRLGVPFLAPAANPALLAGEAARAAAGAGGLKVAAVLYAPTEADEALARAFARAFEAGGGVVARLDSPSGPEWTSPLVQEGPDLVFLAAGAPDAARWIVDLRRAGFGGVLMGGPGLGTPLLVGLAGEASEGVLYVSPLPPLAPDPGFAEAYQALSGGAAPGPAAGWAYAAANRLLDAVDAAARARGGPSREAVGEALAAGPSPAAGAYLYAIRSGNPFTVLEWPVGGQ
jgi:branched-chain amino acid transport system substrate-binding protein